MSQATSSTALNKKSLIFTEFLFCSFDFLFHFMSSFGFNSSIFAFHSKRPDPPSLPGSLRPASVRRSSASWTPTCLERIPRAPRASRPTGKTSMNRTRTGLPAYQTPRSATITPSLVWDYPALPAPCRVIPTTTAAGKSTGSRHGVNVLRGLDAA